MPDSRREIRTRLHVDAPLAVGAELILPALVAHYLGRVLRLQAGAPVRLFNGHDGEWLAAIVALGRGEARLEVRTLLRPQPAPGGVVLAFAPIRRQRMDWLLEKAVELGAARLQPVVTAFAQVRDLRVDRARAIAREAAEQCERLDVPPIAEPVTLAAFVAGWPADAALLFCDETGGGAAASEALAGVTEPLALLVGPEGGFSAGERDLVRRHPGVRGLDLGPLVLRAETAALSALAVVAACRARSAG